MVLYSTPAPTRAGEPVAARRTAGVFYGLAVAAAVLTISFGGIAATTDLVVFDVAVVAAVVVAIVCYGQARYLRGWTNGRLDAGRILDRASQDARKDDKTGQRAFWYDIAAKIASGRQS